MNSNFEKYITDYFNRFSDNQVTSAMKYMMDGGKRIRPEIIFSVVKGYGINEEEAYPCALALEMIQTYSLIHDDLPAMDDDDMRRGKPSCHKAYREDVAILAGDALLTHSFGVIAESSYKPEVKARMIAAMSKYAGMSGMIYGQLLDCTEEVEKTRKGLVEIQDNKTGGLFKIACLFAGYIAGINDEESLIRLGSLIGIIFQNQDDLFDATKTSLEQGKSYSKKDQNKFTALSVYSVEELKEEIEKEFKELYSIVNTLKFDVVYLNEILERIKKR